MRFRLHTKSASSGQVKRNETAIAALSSQVDALQVDVDALSPGGIEIITGANDTFAFRVSNQQRGALLEALSRAPRYVIRNPMRGVSSFNDEAACSCPGQSLQYKI